MSFNYHREHFGARVEHPRRTAASRRTRAASPSASTGWPWRCLPITASIRRTGPRSPGARWHSELEAGAILPLDPRVKRFLEVLAAGNSAGSLDPSVAERRAQITELMRLGGPAPPIGRAETHSIPGAAGP